MFELENVGWEDSKGTPLGIEARLERWANNLTRGPVPTRAAEAVMARAEADLERRFAAVRGPIRSV